MKKKLKNYGFKLDEVTSDQYFFFGHTSLPKEEIQPDGQWDDFLPVYEAQYNSFFDSYGCTVWGTQNALEILTKRLFNYEPNFSERFTYIIGKVRPPGADPHKIAEVIRKYGLIENDLLPMIDTYNDFLKPNPMTAAFLSKGREYLEDFEIVHDWLFTNGLPEVNRTRIFQEVLKSSPICVSVTAWIKRGDVYIDNSQPNNHWCVIYGWTRKGWKVFDSYDQSKKILSFGHKILCAKRFCLTRKVASQSRLTVLLDRLFLAIKSWI